jgi:hypothetical protein
LAQESINPPEQAITEQPLQRDGTSQAGRRLAALDPAYVLVDERSLKDWLAFAREYAKELRYFEAANRSVQATGDDWSGFLGPDLDLDELVAFMQEPDHFSADKARLYRRPHVTLFLTFLHLLRHAQEQLNTLTRRHLDFYYRQVLGMTKKAAVPDQVNLLIDLAADTDQFLLPAGSLLNAGTDSLGQDLFYRTERDIVVNQVQVARLSSCYAEKRVIGLRQAREEHDGPKNEAFIEMLKLALGRPQPGDPLPLYQGETVDYDYLRALQTLVAFVETGLFMELAEFRSLMQLKHQRDQAAPEWREINRLLAKAGRQRTNDPNFQITPADSRDFEANLNLALGGPPNFHGLTEVENIYDLYHQRLRESVQQFIKDELYFKELKDFYDMMQLKVRIDNEWQEINRILTQAGQKKQKLEPPYSLPAGADPTAFAANLKAALGTLGYPQRPKGQAIGDLEAYYTHLLEVESYFFMPAEEFAYLMAVAEKPEATPPEWDKVYAILAEAHRAKVYAERKNALRQVRETEGFEAMISFAVGEAGALTALTALERLEEYIRNAQDAAFLREISQKAATGQVSAEAWEETYRIVELAQRVRLGEPVAQKEEWLNLYPAEDATTVKVALALEAETDSPRWQTFGQGQPLAPQDSPPPAEFGWAISSPLLALSQGQRTITLTLGFGPDQFQLEAIRRLFASLAGPGGPFRLDLSSAKGWVQAETVSVKIGDDYHALSGAPRDKPGKLPALQFELSLAETVAPLTPPAEGARPEAAWPVLRLMLRHIWQPHQSQPETGRYISHYQLFKELALLRTHLKVAVTGLTPAQLQNDETVLAANKPFEPFGTNPVVGSRFYLGHPELVYKKIDNLTFNLEWMGAPQDLAAHYQNYSDDKTGLKNFTGRISLIDRRLDLTLAPAAALFDSVDARKPQSISLADFPTAIAAGRPGFLYERVTETAFDDDLLGWPRYLQWELNTPDFQHQAYPAIAARRSLELTTAIAKDEATGPAESYHINPPYTPKLKKLSLDYTAAIEMILAHYQRGGPLDRLFHIQPFGYHEIQPEARPYPFLPQYDNEGELYIGLRGARPPQNLSLLFQMAEGSADPDLAPAPIRWSYLSGNRWLSLDDGNVLHDASRGLINSGIISFALAPAQPSTLLPPELYWLRAAIPQRSNSVCDTVAIHAQAVSAVFADQDNAPDHLGRPLPAGSITGLAEPLPEVAGVRQPYTSYGGKMAEQDQTFYTRLSERLRHKQRALTIWDYEHLILERFPQIYKVKCLPANPAQPGQVELIVIPDIRNKLPFNPFEPKAPADLIADIETYLADKIPVFATLKVRNAHYVSVKVRFAVRFLPGYNEGYYKQRLNDELNRFLSPWAYEEGAEIVIGGRIYANVIINFIEERPYVDYVAQVKLFSSEDGKTFKLVLPSPTEGYWVETTRPDGVLAAARQHEIDMIPETGYEAENFSGINYMKIELDFIVA